MTSRSALLGGAAVGLFLAMGVAWTDAGGTGAHAALRAFGSAPLAALRAVGSAPLVALREDTTITPELEVRLAELRRRVAALEPRRAYVVIDRANNRLWLRDRDSVALVAVVSTGSGTVLREAVGQRREWVFDTPAGRFEVLGKRRDPIWTKPDWAFIEEGLEPPNSRRAREERGSLGEWALDLGDGYMIHGTLYERLLGRPVTHGCVRVGRDDLRIIAGAVRVGTPVFIF